MSPHQIVLEVQYIGAMALQATITAVMIWRRLYSQARYFFAYILWQNLAVAAMYLVRHKGPPVYYFYAYWITDAVAVALGFAIVIEIFNRIFAPYEGIRRLAGIVFITAAGILLIVAASSFLYHHAAYSVPILTFLLVTERGVRILQLGLILVLFAITRYLHLRWKNYLFGIALGFGFYALTTLAVLLVRMTYGKEFMVITNVLWGTGYCASVVIWTAYVLQPEAQKIPIVSLPSHELEKWDEALKQMLKR